LIIKIRIKALTNEVEKLSYNNNNLIRDIHYLENDKRILINKLEHSESQIMEMKGSHQLEMQQFKEGATNEICFRKL
jgi:hypothetical protein